MPLALTDRQISHIWFISRPLRPNERAAFMAALFEDLLARRDEVGDGELGRTLRNLQHQHFTPPADGEVNERPTLPVPVLHTQVLRSAAGQVVVASRQAAARARNARMIATAKSSAQVRE
jgi:hypothetical protein